MSVSSAPGGRGCSTYGAPVTDNPITAAVGLGGRNVPGDVNTIQQMLNALTPLEGGPLQVLAEDGLFGPLTQAAIGRYQNRVLGWADGRIDANGPTIKALANYIVAAPTVPYGKLGIAVNGAPRAGAANTGKAPSKEGDDDIKTAHDRMVSLEPRLNTLRWRLTRSTPQMLALLNKHFAHKKQTVTNSDIGQVQKILRGVHHYVARANAFGKLPLKNVILYDPSPPGNTIAHTVRGGDKMSTSQIQIYRDKGKNIKSPGQTIWLTSLFSSQQATEKDLVLLHEFAHFVGPRDGWFGTIDDHAYAFEGKFLHLSKFFRLHNAESLALFMLEWCVGTKAIVDAPRMSSVRAHFDTFPKVVAGGDLVTS